VPGRGSPRDVPGLVDGFAAELQDTIDADAGWGDLLQAARVVAWDRLLEAHPEPAARAGGTAMAVSSFEELNAHYGHEVVVVRYGPEDAPVNVAVECETCNEVLLDFDAPGRLGGGRAGRPRGRHHPGPAPRRARSRVPRRAGARRGGRRARAVCGRWASVAPGADRWAAGAGAGPSTARRTPGPPPGARLVVPTRRSGQDRGRGGASGARRQRRC
jgi:hypothetical protein